MWHASILVRALATGERHPCSAHIPFEAVGVALVIGLDRSGLPGALSVSSAPSTDPAALDGPPRCSELRVLYNHAVLACVRRCSADLENLRASTSVPQIFQVRQQESKGHEQGTYRKSGG